MAAIDLTQAHPSRDPEDQETSRPPAEAARRGLLHWFAAFSALMAVPVVLIWWLAETGDSADAGGMGNWPYASALGTSILVVGTLLMMHRARASRIEPVETATTGFVSGVVLLHGKPVPDAKITALRARLDTRADTNGAFALEPLDIGRHVLEVTGCGKRVRRRVTVRAREETYVEFDLDM